MKNDLTLTVVDHGLFLPVALRLARECKKVFYTTESYKPFPSVSDIIGDGFGEVEFTSSVWNVHDQTDVFVFPDVGFPTLQKHLREDAHPVWGSGRGDSLEVLRGKFLDTLDRVGLSVPPHVRVMGMDELRELLREKEDCYIKISRYRGDWETMHWRNWQLDELELERRALVLGPWKDRIVYYVFDPIDTPIEDGADTYSIDGKWPELCLHGMEAKDRALVTTFQKFADLPEQLRVVNEAMGPILQRHDYRGFFSSEVRITEQGEGYFIDPTCRAGSPPHQVQTEMIENYAEVIIDGANGQVIEPEPAAKFGVQAVLDLPGEEEDWRFLTVPEELEQWIKPSMCTRFGDKLAFPPRTHKEVCWLTAVGDTIKEAIDKLAEHCEALPDGVTCEFGALRELIEQIHEAEDRGMTFTDQPVPEPSIVED